MVNFPTLICHGESYVLVTELDSFGSDGPLVLSIENRAEGLVICYHLDLGRGAHNVMSKSSQSKINCECLQVNLRIFLL